MLRSPWQKDYDDNQPSEQGISIASLMIESILTINQYNRYTAYLNALGDNNTGNVSNFLWISPGKTADTLTYQGLVAPVPVPATFWLLGSGLLGLVAIRRRFKK